MARRTIRATLLFFPLLVLTGACGDAGERGGDLAEIRARDTLTVATAYNSTGYFLYRGEPMGFEYELLRAFADSLDLALEMKVAYDPDERVRMLREGEADLAAGRLAKTGELEDEVAFTQALYASRPVLVQRAAPPRELERPERVEEIGVDPDTLSSPLPDSIPVRARLVRRPAGLEGDTVHAPAQSAYIERLVELQDSVGDIEVVEVEPSVLTERLMRRVALGEIRLTVSSENLARLSDAYYTNLYARPVVGEPVRVAWAVRNGSPELLRALDGWIAAQRDSELFRTLYEKYYVDRATYRERMAGTGMAVEEGQLSDFDELLQRHAPAIDWDWRLLAAQTYQESKFDPGARSWAGAMGLLQLMPGTAKEVGVEDPYDPEQNVAGAVRYLDGLQEWWRERIPDTLEARKFILASYNAGKGHVADAQRLAQKHGDDPNAWEDVAFWLLKKSDKRFYTDPVVRYGFARGLEPVTYVAKILDRYGHYREFEPQGAVATAEP